MSNAIFSNPKHFEAIFHEAAIGILVTNAQFNIILSNEFAQSLFGYSEAELLNQNISILIPNHLKGRHEGHLDKLNQQPIARPMGAGLDLKAKRKDESLFPIEISLSHFRENEQMYYIAFVSDVTLKRKVEMELILKNQEINQLNESLEEEVKSRTQALQNTLAQLEIQTHELENALQKEIEAVYIGKEIFLPASPEIINDSVNICCAVDSVLVHRCEQDTEWYFNSLIDMQVTFLPKHEEHLDVDDNIITIPLNLLEKLKFLI
jgi:PAS domain S-box-containing protein